ncbi:23S rRNA gene [Nonlabens ulvanivorans]|nr:four helix bundle protein [Nonlabens ulvanivorans]GAK95063.1 23S rRNA gene [Nonlabens ulvanivorans]
MFKSDYHFKFEDLLVYQKAMAFGEKINTITEGFPKKEMYRLSSQYARAADSIAANISEGYGSTDANFNRYLKMAWDSSHECVTWNSKAFLRKYISHKEFEENRKLLTEIGKMISALRRSLKNK